MRRQATPDEASRLLMNDLVDARYTTVVHPSRLDGPPSPRLEVDDLADTARINSRSRTWTVVLDDDPTGTQTVNDARIVMGDWSQDDLGWAAAAADVSFVLTNSRALRPQAASRATAHATLASKEVAGRMSRRLRVVSRSDST